MKTFSKSLAFLALLGAVSNAAAALTYIDAVPNNGSNGGNTTINGVFADDTSNYVSGINGTNLALQTDNYWYYRTPAASTNNNFPPNGGAFWETDGTASEENAEPLITTITVPAPGKYNLHVMFIAYFTGTNTAYGDIAVDVNNSGSSKFFFHRSDTIPTQAPEDQPGTWVNIHTTSTEFAPESAPFPVGTQWNQQGYHMVLGSLGQFTLAETTVTFKITGPDAKKLSDGLPTFTRTLYEGVAYELAPTTAIPGDFDSDGDVDGADFVAWQTNFPKGAGATLAEGDADLDGDVDGADFVVWQKNFPFTPAPGATSVPEPNAVALTVLAALGVALHRWQPWRGMRVVRNVTR